MRFGDVGNGKEYRHALHANTRHHPVVVTKLTAGRKKYSTAVARNSRSRTCVTVYLSALVDNLENRMFVVEKSRLTNKSTRFSHVELGPNLLAPWKLETPFA